MSMKSTPRHLSALEAAIEDAAARVTHMPPEQLHSGVNEATPLLHDILSVYMAQHTTASEAVKQAVTKLSRTASLPNVRVLTPTRTPDTQKRSRVGRLDAVEHVLGEDNAGSGIPGMGKDGIIR